MPLNHETPTKAQARALKAIIPVLERYNIGPSNRLTHIWEPFPRGAAEMNICIHDSDIRRFLAEYMKALFNEKGQLGDNKLMCLLEGKHTLIVTDYADPESHYGQRIDICATATTKEKAHSLLADGIESLEKSLIP